MLKRKKYNYFRKDYSNPFFRNKRKEKRSFSLPRVSWKAYLLFLVIASAIAGIFWVFLFSHFFRIKNINADGVQGDKSENIKQLGWQETGNKRLFVFSESNLFIFSKPALSEKIKNNYNFDSINIERKLPSTILIEVKEKKYTAIWKEGDKYYFIDSSGNVISEASQSESGSSEFPLIENRGDAKVSGWKLNVDPSELEFAAKLFGEFRDGKDNMKIESIIHDFDLKTVKIKLINGPLIYFNTDADLAKQIEKLLATRKESLKDDFNKKQYIDLRFGDRVYFK